MRSVILLPIMGEKLLLTIPEKYIIYLFAVRFDCTRQSSSAAISKEQKTQNYTEPKFNFSTVLSLGFISLAFRTQTNFVLGSLSLGLINPKLIGARFAQSQGTNIHIGFVSLGLPDLNTI